MNILRFVHHNSVDVFMHEKIIDTYNLQIKKEMAFSIYKNGICKIGTQRIMLW